MSNKWIELPSADAHAVDVARLALDARFSRVERFLPLAAYQYQEDIEHVHQLRTSCRRAGAALEAFRPLMGKKPKELRKLLRRIHKSAGPARDTDVLLSRCKENPPTEGNHDDLIAQLTAQRKCVQPALVKVAKNSRLRKLRRQIQLILASLKRGEREAQQLSFATFARKAIQVASQDVFRIPDSGQLTVAQLHKLRIAGKRLRYSIELFHGAFPPEMRREIYPVIEELQTRLGRLNDHATAQAMYQGWLAELPPGQRAADLARRIVAEYDATIEDRREFLDWWATGRATTLESHLKVLLRSSK